MTETDTSADSIETVIVDVEDVIGAARFNNQPPGTKNQRTAVIRTDPPFNGTVEADLYYSESGTYYPPEMDPKPLHVPPRVFIDSDVFHRLPNRADERARAKQDLEDPDDDEIAEYVEYAFDVWESDVKQALPEETDITDSRHSHGTTHVVDIEYE